MSTRRSLRRRSSWLGWPPAPGRPPGRSEAGSGSALPSASALVAASALVSGLALGAPSRLPSAWWCRGGGRCWVALVLVSAEGRRPNKLRVGYDVVEDEIVGHT